MAKLRKMLGSVEDPAVRELMGLIETQSRTTLTRWAAAYSRRDDDAHRAPSPSSSS